MYGNVRVCQTQPFEGWLGRLHLPAMCVNEHTYCSARQMMVDTFIVTFIVTSINGQAGQKSRNTTLI
ncbi:MAG TPA: hypothetical protein VF670_04060 [Duganella sp.]|jgi:hypothetical protein